MIYVKIWFPFYILIFFISLSASHGFDFSPAKSEEVALILYDIEAEKEVLSINSETPLHYASNLKMLTTAAALHHLGGGFRFMTMFSFDPSDGTLYLKAAGDPEMVIEKMWVLAQDLKRRGVSGVRRVVVDDFIYGEKGYFYVEGGKRGDNAYLAHISPLGLNYNSVEITVSAVEVGKPVDVNITTPGPHFIVNNSAVGVKGSGHGLVIGSVARDGKTEIVVRGSLGVQRSRPERIYRRVANPLNHYVETLLFLLDGSEDIPIERKKLPLSEMSREGNVNYVHKSSPLRDILRTMNRYSSNYIAECVQYFMGAILKKDAGKGVDILRQYALSELGEQVDITNGSGLGNNKNKVPGSFYLKLLKKFNSDNYDMIDFFSSLPVIGEDGTLKRARTNDGCFGCIRGKTGSLTGVTALSGIMRAKSGKVYLYVFAVNNFPAKNFRVTWGFRDRIMHEVWERF